MGTSRNELCKQVPRNCLLPDCSASELLRKQEKLGARATPQEARALREGHSHQGLLFTFGCAGSSMLCWDFLSASGGYSPVLAHGLPIAVAPLAVEHGL